ncbi:MAG: metal-sensing transcriptional repressor [Gemmatimonadota bacterium]
MDREHTGERARCLDADAQRRVEHRLNRLAGQVEGIRRMVGEERGCPEILRQIASINRRSTGSRASCCRRTSASACADR